MIPGVHRPDSVLPQKNFRSNEFYGTVLPLCFTKFTKTPHLSQVRRSFSIIYYAGMGHSVGTPSTKCHACAPEVVGAVSE